MNEPPHLTQKKNNMILEYFNDKISLKKYFLPIVLGGASIFMAYINNKFGVKFSYITFFLPIGISIFLFAFIRPKYIYIFTISVAFFIFYIYRFLGIYFGIIDIPISSIIDGLVFLTFVGMIYQEFYTGQRGNWVYLANPITFALMLYLCYISIHAFNPFQLSIVGWVINIRQLSVFCFCYLISIRFMDSVKFVRVIINIWIVLAAITAIYGCTQEWIGFMDMEQKWINNTVLFTGQVPFFHQGYMRKFSVFSDPTLFGVIMAASSLLCFILATGPISPLKKGGYIVLGVVMLLGMTYSGTRTAYVMIPAGLSLYFLMTLNNKRTIALLVLLGVTFTGLMVAPIYGNRHINRIKTAFIGSQDASLKFRDIKRAASQEYIYTHPIGGGLETTGGSGLKYNNGHELNERHIDSGFLKIALETGWVGLIIFMLFFFCVLWVGIYLYYRCNDKRFKVYLIAIVVFIFSCLIAMYPQKMIFQHPLGLFLFTLFASLGYMYKEKAIYLNKI